MSLQCFLLFWLRLHSDEIFAFWSYFVVIFQVEVDVLYRRAIRTSSILRVL
jgi:hypothetical protein